MKLHRAITLAVMIALSGLLLAAMTVAGVRTFHDAGSLLALGVVIVAAAIAGAAFSWRRYFPRGR